MRRFSSDDRCTTRRAVRQSGVVTMEMIAALPILALSANIIFQLCFDAAFAQGMSFAAVEAAREGSKVFSQQLSFTDPQGEPSYDPRDGDDIADRIAQVAIRRLGVLVPHVHRANGGGYDAQTSGVHIIIRRGSLVAHRGDPSVTYQVPPGMPMADEIEVIIAVRTRKPAKSTNSPNLTAEWVNGRDIGQIGAIRQAGARSPLE